MAELALCDSIRVEHNV